MDIISKTGTTNIRCSSTNEKGSFILEFLISLAIFSVCIIGLVTMQTNALRILGDNRDAMANGFLLEDAIARITANVENASEYTMGFNDGGSGTKVSDIDKNELTASAENFNRYIALTYADDGAGGDANITVTIHTSEDVDEAGDKLIYTFNLAKYN